MLDFQQKRRVRQFMYTPITLCIVGGITLYGVYATWAVYEKKRATEERYAEAEKRIFELEEKNRLAGESVEYLKTDAGVEQEIRSKFSLVKGDEQVIVIVDDPVVQASSTPKKPLSFWDKFLSLFR